MIVLPQFPALRAVNPPETQSTRESVWKTESLEGRGGGTREKKGGLLDYAPTASTQHGHRPLTPRSFTARRCLSTVFSLLPATPRHSLRPCPTQSHSPDQNIQCPDCEREAGCSNFLPSSPTAARNKAAAQEAAPQRQAAAPLPCTRTAPATAVVREQRHLSVKSTRQREAATCQTTLVSQQPRRRRAA